METPRAQSLVPGVGVFLGVGAFPATKNEMDGYTRVENSGGATMFAGRLFGIALHDCFDWQ